MAEAFERTQSQSRVLQAFGLWAQRLVGCRAGWNCVGSSLQLPYMPRSRLGVRVRLQVWAQVLQLCRGVKIFR